MISAELKQLFLSEHARDFRLTIIAYSLIILAIVAIIIFLKYIDINFSEIKINTSGDYAWWPYFAVGMLILFSIGYAVYKLFNDLTNGSKATMIIESEVHEIVIPSSKLNIRLCPVTFIYITLGGLSKQYTLPIRRYYVAEMKKHEWKRATETQRQNVGASELFKKLNVSPKK